jgi:adenosylhomocysteine nucleosidase
MKILVVAALKREVAPLLRKRLPEVECLVTGEGRANAETALRNWLARNRTDAVICAGLAGALSARLQVGDLLMDTRTTLAVTLCGKLEGRNVPTRFGPDHQPSALPSDPMAYLHLGRIITVDEILNAAGKARLAATLDPCEVACVEMESAAIVAVCLEHKVPVLLIRAISDRLDQEFPIDFNACRTADGRVSTAKVLQKALARPQAISGLFGLHRRVKLCAERLALFVEQAMLLLRENREE